MSSEIIKPEQLEGFLGDIEDVVPKIREAYRWAYPNAYQRPSHGHHERTSGGDGSSDPVADLVASTERYRVKLRHALREVAEARNRMLGAQADLNDALAMLDPPQTTDPVEHSLVHPANRGDLARARQAKDRREKRAAKDRIWGSSEITG